ncbi:hypothetical protein ACV3VU_04955 [Clostridium perfringens]
MRNHYPMLWKKMLCMDKDSPIAFKADATRLADIEERFRREDMKITKKYSLVEPRLFCEAKQLVMKL